MWVVLECIKFYIFDEFMVDKLVIFFDYIYVIFFCSVWLEFLSVGFIFCEFVI